MKKKRPELYDYWKGLPAGDEQDAVMARTKYLPAPAIPLDPSKLQDYWYKNYTGERADMPEQETVDFALKTALEMTPLQRAVAQQTPVFQPQPMQVPQNVIYPLNMGNASLSQALAEQSIPNVALTELVNFLKESQ